MDHDAKLRTRCLELASEQAGPWKSGTLKKHNRTVLALAMMYFVFVNEGFVPALKIANNKVRLPPKLNVAPVPE